MKIKDGFILREVAGQYIVVAAGEASKDFNGVIQLNEEAAYAFDLLKEEITEEELVDALMKRYSVAEAEVRADVTYFIGKLREAGTLV